jgi:hypothetical protein
MFAIKLVWKQRKFVYFLPGKDVIIKIDLELQKITKKRYWWISQMLNRNQNTLRDYPQGQDRERKESKHRQMMKKRKTRHTDNLYTIPSKQEKSVEQLFPSYLCYLPLSASK